MKKLSLALCAILAIAFMFSMTACEEIENGVTIKFVTFTLDFVDADGENRTEDITVKLYTNYAPESTARVMELAENGKYNNTNVNHVDSNWFTLGGFTVSDTAVTPVESGKGNLVGEFQANGLSGNKLTVSAGSVVMYRAFRNDNSSNFNTADMALAICTSSSAPFTASQYCVIGKIVDNDQLDVLQDILDLRNVSDDEEEVEYNRYYVGGIADIAKSFLNEDGTLNSAEADDHDIELADVNKVIEDGELFFEPGYMTAEDYEEFEEVATKFINSISENSATYFYNVPKNPVTVTSVKVSNNA